MFEKESNGMSEDERVDFVIALKRKMCLENGKVTDSDVYFQGVKDGYNKGKEELTERLDNATEIIELMKDLFFDCWQEKGLKAIKFEQRVNDYLKGE